MNGCVKKSLLMLALIMLERIASNYSFVLFSTLPQSQYCHLRHRHTKISSSSSNNNNLNNHDHDTALTKSSTTRPFHLQRIDHIVIRCHNFPAMFDFYTRILGCTIDEPRNNHVNRFRGAMSHLRAGTCYIDLLSYDVNHLTEEGKEFAARSYAGGMGIGNSSVEDLVFSADSSTLDHLCIRIEPFDEKSIKSYLMDESVDIVAEGGERLGADGVGPSIYVRDPEGNVVELKGKPTLVTNSGDNIDNSARKQITATSKGKDITQSPAIVDKENIDHIRQSDDYSETSSTDVNIEGTNIPITPCNRICRYNNSFYNGQVCIGCFREEYEIKTWQSMTASEKSVTLLDQIDRCRDAERSNISYDGAVTDDELRKQYHYWAMLAEES